MTDMTVILTQEPAQDPWRSEASYSIVGHQIRIHWKESDGLRKLQKTAKGLQSLPFKRLHLSGPEWTAERHWVFSQGLDHPSKAIELTADHTDPLLAHRISTARWLKKVLNGSPEEMYPTALIREIDAFLRSLTTHITSLFIEGEALKEAGWMGTYSVGKGSDRPPVIAIYDYNPTGNSNAPVSAVLVGKGVTFDAGGYSLKSSEGMVSMKMDKGGAVTVAAALGDAIQRGLKSRVKVIIPAVENLVSGRAYKLGDIITYNNGETVEILNTDAEGRLILADALIMASREKPQWIVDAATLTGAIGTALAEDYTGLFSQSDALSQRIMEKATAVSDPVWRMPLDSWHKEAYPSSFAKIANAGLVKGGGLGGSSMAAGFLTRFVEPGIPFAHLDIAYTAYSMGGNALYASGATGRVFSYLADLLMDPALPS